jgi:hypothetical protein
MREKGVLMVLASCTAAVVVLGSGPCYGPGRDDGCFAREGACPAGEYCLFMEDGWGGEDIVCTARKAENERCHGPDWLNACGRSDPQYQRECAIEQAEQCIEGTTCRLLTGTEDQRFCSAGRSGNPCAEDEDCDADGGFLCAGPEVDAGLRRCVRPGFLGQGDPCDRTPECAEGLVCWSPASCSGSTTCQPPGALRARCCEDGQCESELTCLTFEPEPFCWRADEGVEGEACATDRHCLDGLACVIGDARRGTCAGLGAEGAFCQEDRHCEDGLRCVAREPGRCSSGGAGAPCAHNADCAGELVCHQQTWVCFER